MAELSDSAGVPFAGRSFTPNPGAGDDGGADPRLLEALKRFRAGGFGQAEVVDAARQARLLIPLLAERGDEGVGARGRVVDKTQELSIVSVGAPDGRAVLPAFTSVKTLVAWNPVARPIPTPMRRVAIAAAGEGTELVVIDPGSPTEFGVRRTALRSIALDQPWTPSWADDEVADAFARSVSEEIAVRRIALVSGDPDARLAGAELIVGIELVDGLDRAALNGLRSRLATLWSGDELITDRVDSIVVRFVSV